MTPKSRIINRNRNNWEALDLGHHIFKDQAFKLIALWFCVSLPFFLVLSLVFWNHPFWAVFFLWLFKPMFEAGILTVVSNSIFNQYSSFKTDLKHAFRLCFRPRIIGDLTWRRLSTHRSLLLPINTLEHLQGKRFSQRANEIRRASGSQATWLSFFGVNIEMILSTGLGFLLLWLLFDNPVEYVIAPEFRLFKSIWQIMQLFWSTDNLNLYEHTYNLIYFLVLCFWGPIYVTCGFSLYLQSRTQLEAWDLKVSFQDIAKRLAQSLSAFAIICILSILPNQYSMAKNIEQEQRAVLTEKPLPYIDKTTKWCWKTCDKAQSTPEKPQPTNLPNAPDIDFRSILFVILAIIVIVGLFYAVSKMQGLSKTNRTKTKAHDIPDTLFGLDIAPESLPDNPLQAALNYAKNNDFQGALSILYRTALIQLLHQQHLPIQKSTTEGEVLQLVAQHAPNKLAYLQALTLAWQQVTYGHYDSSLNQLTVLCEQFSQAFPKAISPQETKA